MTANTIAPSQAYPALDPATEAALRASIEQFGVLVPIVHDQNGNILDGHHRTRIAAELGIDPKIDVIRVRDDEEAREVALALNAIRRQLTPQQRRELVVALVQQGHSGRATAAALRVSHTTVRRDLEATGTDVPDELKGMDGRTRSTTRNTKRLVRPPKQRQTPFVPVGRAQEIRAQAEASKLKRELERVDGAVKQLSDLDYGMAAFGLGEELRRRAADAAKLARQLNGLETGLKAVR